MPSTTPNFRRFITAGFFLLLYLLLLARSPGLWRSGHLLLGLATWIILLHVGLGAYVLVWTLSVPETGRKDLLSDFLLLLLLLPIPFVADDLRLWGLAFGLFFLMVRLKYRALIPRLTDPVAREYVTTKLRCERSIPVLFLVLALAAQLLRPDPTAQKVLEATTLLLSAALTFWLIVIKRAYHAILFSHPPRS